MSVAVHHADCVAFLAARAALAARGAAPLFDGCACDPPYHLVSVTKRLGKPGSKPIVHGTDGAFARASAGFMGKSWDGGDVAARVETWRAVFDNLKPGAWLVAFGGTRTYHRMVCAIEDAGFEIRDQLAWVYGSGFPKSRDVSKEIDRLAGAERKTIGTRRSGPAMKIGGDNPRPWHERQAERGGEFDVTAPATESAREWDGWGTALKPAWEPIVLARKPLEGTVAGNVLRHGTGALNIGGCRIEHASEADLSESMAKNPGRSDAVTSAVYGADRPQQSVNIAGRWPANIMHDGSEEVVAAFPADAGGGFGKRGGNGSLTSYGFVEGSMETVGFGDSGSGARFFYSAKAGPLDRLGSGHPTVKPVDLMRWLLRLIVRPGGLVLDPFAGSGSTGIAALAEGMRAELIDIEADHVADIERKLALLRGEGRHLLATLNERKSAAQRQKDGDGPLFAGAGG